jgi:hypothetical protein
VTARSLARVRSIALCASASHSRADCLLRPAAAPPGSHTLIASVGKNDAFTITLTLDGKRVTHLRAGTYTIVVYDYSKIHNVALGSISARKRIFIGSIPGVRDEDLPREVDARQLRLRLLGAPHDHVRPPQRVLATGPAMRHPRPAVGGSGAQPPPPSDDFTARRRATAYSRSPLMRLGARRVVEP